LEAMRLRGALRVRALSLSEGSIYLVVDPKLPSLPSSPCWLINRRRKM
jgi:hypothetical protein